MKLFKIPLLLMALSLLFVGVATFAVNNSSNAVYAETFHSDACDGLKDLGAGGKCGDSGDSFTKVFKTVVSILSEIIGVVAVVMVMISGFKYITSGGDAGKVSSAKNTLIYALIGVVVAALAQALVHFALGQTN